MLIYKQVICTKTHVSRANNKKASLSYLFAYVDGPCSRHDVQGKINEKIEKADGDVLLTFERSLHLSPRSCDDNNVSTTCMKK